MLEETAKVQDAEVTSVTTEPTEQPTQEQPPVQIEVTPDVAFNLKLQEYDKNIAAHKAEAAKLEAEKVAFIYNSNVQGITEQHKEKIIKQQIEEETKRKMLEKEAETKKK